jgi:hypothetical protein
VSRSAGGKKKSNGVDLVELEEEGGAVEDFFGQLWYIPAVSPSLGGQVRVRHRGLPGNGDSLVWIRKDLWESKTFEAGGCFPIGVGDSWSGSPKKLSFTVDIWGKGVKDSFVSKLKGKMASRGRGGRGLQRPRSPEEEWGWGDGGWYQNPPPYYQPPMGPPPMGPPPMGPYPPPPPSPFGFFPNQLHNQSYFNQGQQSGAKQFNSYGPRGQGPRPGGRGVSGNCGKGL